MASSCRSRRSLLLRCNVLPRPTQMGDNMVEILKFSRETAFTPETIQILAAALDEAWERLRQSGSRLTRPRRPTREPFEKNHSNQITPVAARNAHKPRHFCEHCACNKHPLGRVRPRGFSANTELINALMGLSSETKCDPGALAFGLHERAAHLRHRPARASSSPLVGEFGREFRAGEYRAGARQRLRAPLGAHSAL